MWRKTLIQLIGVICLASALSAGADSIRIHLGLADLKAIADGTKALSLIEPEIALKPAYDRDVSTYAATIPSGAEGVTFVLETTTMSSEFGIVDRNGTRGQFAAVTYEGDFHLRGKIIPVALAEGDNRVRVGFKAPFGRARIYDIAIVRTHSD